MKKVLLACSASAALAVGPAYAEEKGSTQEAVGVGGGALIGAIAGGPVGLVLGAGIGAWLGDKVHDARTLDGELTVARTELGTTREALARARLDVTSLEQALHARDLRITRLEQTQYELEHGQALGRGLQIEVLFRTAGSELAPQAEERITELGTLLTAVPDLRVRLDGYADPRGDERYNETLSTQRVEQVKRALLAGGMSAERIESFAHGETQSSAGEGDLDAYALERRVSITFVDPSQMAAVAELGERPE